jgi:hypothetical protein
MTIPHRIENSTDASNVAAPIEITIPKMSVMWKTSSVLWRTVICVATIGLFACITAIAVATIAPTLIPGLAVFIYTFYRLAVGCLLAMFLASFFFIFSIDWAQH